MTRISLNSYIVDSMGKGLKNLATELASTIFFVAATEKPSGYLLQILEYLIADPRYRVYFYVHNGITTAISGYVNKRLTRQGVTVITPDDGFGVTRAEIHCGSGVVILKGEGFSERASLVRLKDLQGVFVVGCMGSKAFWLQSFMELLATRYGGVKCTPEGIVTHLNSLVMNGIVSQEPCCHDPYNCQLPIVHARMGHLIRVVSNALPNHTREVLKFLFEAVPHMIVGISTSNSNSQLFLHFETASDMIEYFLRFNFGSFGAKGPKSTKTREYKRLTAEIKLTISTKSVIGGLSDVREYYTRTPFCKRIEKIESVFCFSAREVDIQDSNCHTNRIPRG